MKYKAFKRCIKLGLLSLVAILALSSPRAQAETLASLILPGGQITYGGLIFDNFTATPHYLGGAPSFSLDDISVVGVTRYGKPGLEFVVPLMVTQSGEYQDIALAFNVRTTSGEDLIIEHYLEVIGGTTANGPGLGWIFEGISDESSTLGTLIVGFTGSGANLDDSLQFDSPQNFLRVGKDVGVRIPDGSNCSSATLSCMAGISHFWQLFDLYPPRDIPEPSSMLLLGLGLAGLAIVRRRRSTK
jgi:hypothetical protein